MKTNIPLSLLTGAIVSGSYIGDHSSPMSSSANLTAVMTKTKLSAILIIGSSTAFNRILDGTEMIQPIIIKKIINFINTWIDSIL